MVLREESVRDQVTVRGGRPFARSRLGGRGESGAEFAGGEVHTLHHEGNHLPTLRGGCLWVSILVSELREPADQAVA
jgi:hypothetical protein